MGSSKRSRSGRKRVRTRPNKLSVRQKEEAEISRIEQSVRDIPHYSTRFQLFRLNRRQKAKLLSEKSQDPQTCELEHSIFQSTRFTELPLSSRTLDGLAAANFTELTGIQKTAIPQALAERDILAAAPTGSGKTLAFLVPMLEVLWRKKWNTNDGLGALILCPTRELGIQIFEVLRSVARQHTISAGLVIGGKDFEGEKEKVAHMNILVATPGRLLHHMDQVVNFDCSNLKVLVLDEADRILDLGFAKTVDAILLNLPEERQTMLFSATQTKNVKALARLSLKEPEYVAISSTLGQNFDPNEDDPEDNDDGTKEENRVKIVGTPAGLRQSYTVVPEHEKLSVLWSFVKTHLKSKMIVFFSTGKQVRFAFETFCKLRPGMSLLHIHGNMKQLKRTDMYDLFCRTKTAALFATDVASRGLDFPDVEWVVQLDCPDDVGTYIHRVGRTARFKAQGHAMLMLSEGSEEKFLKRLEAKNLQLSRTKINPQRITDISPRLAAIIASNQELKKLAQRAFTFYMKSICLRSDKEVFDVTKVDYVKLAKSYGLSNTPRVSIRNQLLNHTEIKEKSTSIFGYKVRQKREEKQQHLEEKEVGSSSEAGEGDRDILVLRKKDENVSFDGDHEEDKFGKDKQHEYQEKKRKKRKLDLLGGMPSANRLVFSEDGTAIRAGDIVASDSKNDESDSAHEGIEEYAASVASKLAKVEAEDKKREQKRVRSLHSRMKLKKREKLKIRGDPSADANSKENEDEDSSMLDSQSSSDDSERSSGTEDEEIGDDKALKVDEERALDILRSRS